MFYLDDLRYASPEGKDTLFLLKNNEKKMRSKLKLLCYPTKFVYITYLQYVTTVANM